MRTSNSIKCNLLFERLPRLLEKTHSLSLSLSHSYNILISLMYYLATFQNLMYQEVAWVSAVVKALRY